MWTSKPSKPINKNIDKKNSLSITIDEVSEIPIGIVS
jgi:hypothetical protein